MSAFRRQLLLISTLTACGHHASLLDDDSLPVAQPLAFGTVLVSQTQTLPLALTNEGTELLQIEGITFSGANAADFTVSGTPASLSPSETVQLQITFAPSVAGAESAVLDLQSSSGQVPVLAVPLSGTGEEPSLTVTPDPLVFGSVLVGTSATLALTITNTGTTLDAQVAAQPTTGPQAGAFAAQTSALTQLAPGQSFQLPVVFTPLVGGANAATLPLVPCTGCLPLAIGLSGDAEAAALTITPNPIAFDNVPAGATSTQSVRVANTGMVPVTATAVGLQAGGAVPFTLSPLSGLPVSLMPGFGFNLQVSFTPTATTGDQNALEVVYQVPGLTGSAEAQAPLQGDLVYSPCHLVWQPATESFGLVQPGKTYAKTLVFRNTGAIACHVTGLALQSTSDPAFSIAAGTPTSLTVPPTGSATVGLRFAIASAGPPAMRTGALQFQADDRKLPQGSVPLVAYLSSTSPYALGWPKWHMDNTDQGQSEADTSALKGSVAWKFSLGVAVSGITDVKSSYLNGPVVGPDGTLYQVALSGALKAINPSGQQIWSSAIASPANDPHPAIPVIAADGTLFVESGADALMGPGGFLYDFAPDGGALDSQLPITTPCRESTDQSGNAACYPADGFDVCPSIGNSGLLFDADDFGQTAIYKRGPGGLFALADAIILPFFGERVAVALDEADNSYWCSANACFGVNSPDAGTQPFQQMAAWPSEGSLIAPNAPPMSDQDIDSADLAYDNHHTGWLMVSVAWQDLPSNTARTELSALDRADGSIHWTYDMPTFTPPSISAIDPVDAALFSPYVGNAAPAIGDDGTVYVGNGDGLYAIDGATGQLQPGFPFHSAIVTAAPAIGGDGTIFFGCADGTFYAINPDGSLRFKLGTGSVIAGSPAIGPDGTVYFVDDSGTLYAVH